MYVSDCCGAPVYDKDCPICSDCKEWCELSDEEEDEETEPKNDK